MGYVLKCIMMGQGSPSGNPTIGKAIGDSTIAPGTGKTKGVPDWVLTGAEINAGYVFRNQAVGGHTINSQLTVWRNDPNKLEYDYIVIQVGLNDLNGSNPQTPITNYQNLVNEVRSGIKSTAKIIVCCMLPCRQRFIDLNIVNGQTNWEALNNAIMTTITNVDARVDSHLAILDDGTSNLKAMYDSGDHIHENDEGAKVIANAWRIKLVEMGLLTVA